MPPPINLNHARKAKAKAADKAQAAQNRVKHGRTAEQKAADRAEAQIATTRLDAHRRNAKDEAP